MSESTNPSSPNSSTRVFSRSLLFNDTKNASGVTMFFFVNEIGESFFGIQIGHEADQFAPSSMTVDVILSGEAKPSANRQPAWIVKEGL